MNARLALIYPDGSITVLSETMGVDAAFDEAELADRGETDPAQFTKIARVELKFLEMIDAPPTAQAFNRPASGREIDEIPVAACPAELAVRLYEANYRLQRHVPDAIAALSAMEKDRAEAWLRSAKAAADYFVELLDKQRRI